MQDFGSIGSLGMQLVLTIQGTHQACGHAGACCGTTGSSGPSTRFWAYVFELVLGIGAFRGAYEHHDEVSLRAARLDQSLALNLPACPWLWSYRLVSRIAKPHLNGSGTYPKKMSA